MNKHLVFVYGTLRRGGSNHDMLSGSDFLGEHHTEPRYTMFRLGRFPAVVARGDTAVAGEIYRIDDEVFALLDELERYPSLFSRRTIATPSGRAWIYLYNRPVDTDSTVAHGDWQKLLAERS